MTRTNLLEIIFLLKKWILYKNRIITDSDSSYQDIQNVLEKYPIFPILEQIDPFPLGLFKECSTTAKLKINKSNISATLRKLGNGGIGQYFTNEEIINKIYLKLQIKEELSKTSKKLTISDLSAGIGNFLLPMVKEHNAIIYGVELDPIAYSIMLYNLVLNKELESKRMTQILVGLKNGDALLGLKNKKVNNIVKERGCKEIIQELKEIRLKIIKSQNSFSDIEHLLSLRKQIAQMHPSLSKFNWIVDFPEIFLDFNGFDYVLGNPPWKIYNASKKAEYKEAFHSKPFSNLLYGKFNFAMPFVVLAYTFTKHKGSLVIPKGLLCEHYGLLFRKKIVEERSLESIELLTKKHFPHVSNEYGILSWDKKQPLEKFDVVYSQTEAFSFTHSEVKKPTYLVPLIPEWLLGILKRTFLDLKSKLADICIIRRGLTLTKRYQQQYQKFESSENFELKKIIRHNTFSFLKQEGIHNFQVFYGGEQFYYDRKLLGAPASELFFERSKIIRRNRGRKWLIGLDHEGQYYVNDIFDVIIPIKNQSLYTLFGYLVSSIVHYYLEHHLVRDITSNFVRSLPAISFSEYEQEIMEQHVRTWLNSKKELKDFKVLREKIDEIIFTALSIPSKASSYIIEQSQKATKNAWKDIKEMDVAKQC
ncbi:MAG: Eco57I restriction-modification methylase domain-containing protein [Candidatus Heimdallarchaeaceae archaeon]